MRAVMSAHSDQHCVMVGKRHLFQHAFGAILVKGRPAAILALEGQHPFQPALEALVALLPSSVGTLRSASSTMAVSSTSGFHLFSNSKTNAGLDLGGFLYCQSPETGSP